MKPLKDQAHAIWLHLIIFSFIFHGASHSVSGSIPLGMSINSHYLLFSWFIVLTGPKHLNAIEELQASDLKPKLPTKPKLPLQKRTETLREACMMLT